MLEDLLTEDSRIIRAYAVPAATFGVRTVASITSGLPHARTTAAFIILAIAELLFC
jgi:hypothetical protein